MALVAPLADGDGIVYKDGRPVQTHGEAQASVRAAQAALLREAPQGPNGPAAAHVFAFADSFNPMLCHLARTVEAAGGWLHVLGLRNGRTSKLPGGDVDKRGGGPSTREGEPWHFADKSIMLKKHLFLQRALRHLPPNHTAIFVDAFDVLFQRSLAELAEAYRELAGPIAAAHKGAWPVVYGGEVNCWPFPHNGAVPIGGRNAEPRGAVHRIPADASLSAGHHGDWRYGYGDRSPWEIRGDQICSEWLSVQREGEARGAPAAGMQMHFPFLCAGTFIGTVSALRRLLRRLLDLYAETGEYHDQALLAVLLLRNRTLGLVDAGADIFLELHGHDEFKDLERPLCRGSYFAFSSEVASRAAENQRGFRPRAPVPGYRPTRSLAGLVPPAVVRGGRRARPGVLHFNGNGKRHLLRCIDEFRAEGILGGAGAGGAGQQGGQEEEEEEEAECTFFDQDRRVWQRYR